jgi:hypothetical protein
LLAFKSDFNGHEIEVVVYNARTHSARAYSINDFSRDVNTKCPVDTIEYLDQQGKPVSVPCYFTSGPHCDQSKGLVELAKDLNMPLMGQMTLSEVRALLSTHPAFQNVSRLKTLSRK